MIRQPWIPPILMVIVTFTSALFTGEGVAQSGWKAQDMSRPVPPVEKPPRQELPVAAPPDALVLFDGGDLSKWQNTDGGPAGWVVSDGAMISVAGSGYLVTREKFGDIQLHLEWAAPLPVVGDGQGRGNSGVYLMGRYEIQVLDSYENPTYPDGQAAAVYGQHPPLTNVCRPPGEWQSYDIFFRRPRFSRAGALSEPARVTVLHNGVLVQNNTELWGPTNWLQSLPYQAHAEELPLALQDHGNPVRYRNIWLRKLPEPDADSADEGIRLSTEALDRYAGQYVTEDGSTYRLVREGDELKANFIGSQLLDLIAESPERFVMKRTAGVLEFELDGDGIPTGLTFHIGGGSRKARKVR